MIDSRTPPPPPPSKEPSSPSDAPTDHPAQREPDSSTAEDQGSSDALTAVASLPRIGVAVSSAGKPMYMRPFRRLASNELRKLRSGSSEDDLPPPERLPVPPLSVVVEPEAGESGTHSSVHYGRLADPQSAVNIVFKVSTDEAEDSVSCLANEGILYDEYGHLLVDLLPQYVGTCIGSWQNVLRTVLILQRHGSCFEDWSELTQSQRTDVMACLKKLHSVGIKHCDLKPWNVLYDPATDKLKLVDLSRAKEHDCPGAVCDELVEARALLGLPSAG